MPTKSVHASVSVKQLLNLIPDEELGRLSGEIGVDYWASVLYGKSMFYLLLYGLADGEKTSLRSLEDIFNSRRFKYLFNLDPYQTKYTVCLEDLLPSSVQIFTEQKHLNEDLTIPSTILKMMDPRPDTVFVFDRGVRSRKAYEDITKKEWMFVTRVKEDTVTRL